MLAFEVNRVTASATKFGLSKCELNVNPHKQIRVCLLRDANSAINLKGWDFSEIQEFQELWSQFALEKLFLVVPNKLVKYQNWFFSLFNIWPCWDLSSVCKTSSRWIGTWCD